MAIKTIGIDLGKTVFVAVALDGRGRLVRPARRYSPSALVRWLANLPPCLIGMEASSGAHHLARTLQAQGHAVRLLPGQAVKPFRGAIKNDAVDALALAEAAHRPGLRPVPVKSAAQLDVQAIQRVRTQLVRERTALINQVRSLLRERGIAMAQGPHRLAEALIELLVRRPGSAPLWACCWCAGGRPGAGSTPKSASSTACSWATPGRMPAAAG